MKVIRLQNWLYGATVMASTLGVISHSGYAKSHSTMMMGKNQPTSVSLEKWPGRRVVLVLPVTLSSNWNGDPTLGRALLSDADSQASHALRASGKLSVMSLNRFDPLLVRSVQDGKMKDTELTELTDPISTVPWLERGRTALSRLTFDQPALIGDFSLEELRTVTDGKRQSVQVQVSGRFYELGADAPQTVVVTSDPVKVSGNPYPALVSAIGNAMSRIAYDYTKPIDAYNLVSTNGQSMQPGMGGMKTTNPVAPPSGSGPQATAVGSPNTTSLPTAPAPTAPSLPGAPATDNAAPATTNPVPAPATTPGGPTAPAPTAPDPGAPGTSPAPAPTTPAPGDTK